MFPAIFLDRDGVIIENCSNYVRSWADVDIYPQALEALARLKDSPYKIVLVTNQSVVGRGLISRNMADDINERLVRIIERAGGRVDGVFMCPHAPADSCNCRKPKPGLILNAAEELSIDLNYSFMIGDALTDIAAGHAAQVKTIALVRTGRGEAQLLKTEAKDLRQFLVYEDLTEAVSALIFSGDNKLD